MQATQKRDHGGGIDAARSVWGGQRDAWLDLSTGINPVPYPIADIPPALWQALPDTSALSQLESAARSYWRVPDTAACLAAPGASAIIASLPSVLQGNRVDVPEPTYNEYLAAFRHFGWDKASESAEARVLVHPNNPDGRLWTAAAVQGAQVVIDESFADVCPEASLIGLAADPGRIVLKSFGKFWGLAGLRLGFAFGDPAIIEPLRQRIGPWAVSGPALEIGRQALEDPDWAAETRIRLAEDAQRLDALLIRAGARALGGTTLFRLYDTNSAQDWQDRFARHKIWTRIFPYSDKWLRLGLPPQNGWPRLETALAS